MTPSHLILMGHLAMQYQGYHSTLSIRVGLGEYAGQEGIPARHFMGSFVWRRHDEKLFK